MGNRNSNFRKALNLSAKRKELEEVRMKRIQAEETLKRLKAQIAIQDANMERDRTLALTKLEEIKQVQKNIDAGVEQTIKAMEDEHEKK